MVGPNAINGRQHRFSVTTGNNAAYRPGLMARTLLCVYVCGILINVMPNKTIYIKDTDLPLLEQAQEQLGDSVSSMFAEFLRERVAKLTPEENRIIELINQITTTRETLKRQRDLREFI